MKSVFPLLAAGWALLLVGAVAAQPHGAPTPADPLPANPLPVDLARGARLFETRCARCHGLKGDGPDGLGPSLIGIIGTRAASRNDFLYTKALEARTDIWTPALLDRFLADPQAFAPGTEMEIRIDDPAERAAIIAHVGALH